MFKMSNEYLIGVRVSIPGNISNPDDIAKDIVGRIESFLTCRPGVMLDSPNEELEFQFLSAELAVPIKLDGSPEEFNADDAKKYEPEASVLYADQHAARLREIANEPDPRDGIRYPTKPAGE